MSVIAGTRDSIIPSSSVDRQSPTASMVWAHGHILGVELPVIDLIRAKAFYENVFNWEFLRYGESSIVHFKSGSVTGIVHQVEEYDHYTLVHDHSQGAMISKSGKRAAARCVGFMIQVEDMDNTLDEVKRAGGRVWLKAQEFHDDAPSREGYFAYILDTEDNVIGLRSISGGDSMA